MKFKKKKCKQKTKQSEGGKDMWVTLIVLLEVYSVYYIGEITKTPFLVCVAFFLYFTLSRLQSNSAFRTSKIIQWLLPDVEMRGPGLHLLCDPANKCCEACTPFKEQKRAVFAIHPHGVHAITSIRAFCFGEMNLNRRFAAHGVLFKIPVLREFTALAGAIPADRNSMIEVLESGKQLVLCPGALRELKEDHGVKQRSGFIRVAAKVTGAVLVPVWAADETSLYIVGLPFGHFFSDTMKLRYPWLIASFGKWWLWFWPKNLGRPLRLYVGSAIEVDETDIDGTQARFYDAVNGLKAMAMEDKL